MAVRQASLPLARVDVARGVAHLAEALALPRHEHALVRAVRGHPHRRHAVGHAVPPHALDRLAVGRHAPAEAVGRIATPLALILSERLVRVPPALLVRVRVRVRVRVKVRIRVRVRVRVRVRIRVRIRVRVRVRVLSAMLVALHRLLGHRLHLGEG